MNPKPHKAKQQRTRRSGIILVLVLVVVSVLALACLGFADLMLSERKAAVTASRLAQARAFAQSGAELCRQFLDRTGDDQLEAGGLYDNPYRFDRVVVVDDPIPQNCGWFSVVAPDVEDRAVLGVRYGLQDESARINLATLLQADKSVKGGAKDILMNLPSMTEEIADAILDWLDTDDTPRENGAESSYYGSLASPYAPRNGAPATIDELLLVRGVTPELLYGLDAARMGLVASTGDFEAIENVDGDMDHGWAAYLTLWSNESTLKSDGTKKINLNDSNLESLYEDLKTVLDEQQATFIVAYRAYGALKSNSSSSENATNVQLDFSKLKASASIASVYDLIGASVGIPQTNSSSQSNGKNASGSSSQSKVKRLRSPFTNDTSAMSDYLPKLFKNTTVQSGASFAGRININQAPRIVLQCIPGITTDIVDQIVSKRVMDPLQMPEDQETEAWPLLEGVVPLGKMKTLQPFMTAGGCVYRAQVIGSFEKGGPTARIEVILNAKQSPTKLLFWKDMSRAAGGFPVEPASDEN